MTSMIERASYLALMVAVMPGCGRAQPTDAGTDGDAGCSADAYPSSACLQACSDIAELPICTAGAWRCPEGSTPQNQCSCPGAPPGPGCGCGASGWSCPDAGAADQSSTVDAGCPGFPDSCFGFLPDGSCSDFGSDPVCQGGAWTCPVDTVPMSMCRCIVQPPNSSC